MPGCVRLVMVIAAFACVAPLPAQADTKVPETREMVMLSFAPLVKVATPAVVNIYATRVVEQADSPFAGDPFFSQFFGEGLSRPRVQNSLGSGVIVRQDGVVVSNYHVVGGASDIRVVLADRREFAAKVLLADEAADLAILSLEGASELPALSLANSDKAAVGDLVLAIGNPFGVGQTVTTGIVSGLARSGGEMGRGGGYFIQTDAAINPGNSGGALVDIQGNLLGINTAIVSPSGGSTGIGFAIPSNLVERYVQAAESGLSKVPAPWSGADVQTVDADMALALDMDLPRGVMIQRLHPQSPLRAAGLNEGDIILSVGGQTVDSPGELDYRLAVLGVGQKAAFSYLRGGTPARAEVTLAEPPSSNKGAVNVGGRTLLTGLQVADVDPALIDTLNLPLDAKGVVVTGVDGPSSRTGLQAGDILTALNGNEITSAPEFAKIAEAGAPYWEIEVIRGNQRGTIRFGG